MSFSFAATGDREQVARQLLAAKTGSDDALKNALIDLLAEHVDKSELHGYAQSGLEYRQVYMIEASGHSGPGSALSLTVQIRSPYVPVLAEVTGEAAADADDQDTAD